MPELLTPGVYIQEVAFGPSPIEGVATSTAGFVGEAERGPVSGTPILVTSFTDYQRQFGGFVSGKYLAYAVRGFFDNGGKRAFIARVVAKTPASEAATQASTGPIPFGYDVALLAGTAGATPPGTWSTPATTFTLRVTSVVGVSENDSVTLIDRTGQALQAAPVVVVLPATSPAPPSVTVFPNLQATINLVSNVPVPPLPQGSFLQRVSDGVLLPLTTVLTSIQPSEKQFSVTVDPALLKQPAALKAPVILSPNDVVTFVSVVNGKVGPVLPPVTVWVPQTLILIATAANTVATTVAYVQLSDGTTQLPVTSSSATTWNANDTITVQVMVTVPGPDFTKPVELLDKTRALIVGGSATVQQPITPPPPGTIALVSTVDIPQLSATAVVKLADGTPLAITVPNNTGFAANTPFQVTVSPTSGVKAGDTGVLVDVQPAGLPAPLDPAVTVQSVNATAGSLVLTTKWGVPEKLVPGKHAVRYALISSISVKVSSNNPPLALLANTSSPLPVTTVGDIEQGDTVALINSNTGQSILPAGATVTVNSVSVLQNTINITSSIAVPVLDPASTMVVDLPSNALTITARDPGAFGDDLRVLLLPVYLGTATIVSVSLPNQEYVLSTVAPFEVNGYVELAPRTPPKTRELPLVSAVDLTKSSITVQTTANPPWGPGDYVRALGWRLYVYYQGNLVETIDGIGSNPSGPDGLLSINTRSQWVRVPTPINGVPPAFPTFGEATTQSDYPWFFAGAPAALINGNDGQSIAPSRLGDPDHYADLIGSDVPPRSGLKAIEALSDVEIIAAPGFTDVSVVTELIGQAERRKDRFAVFEGSLANAGLDGQIPDVLDERGNYNSQYAAMYYPWVTVLDPLTGLSIPIPPSGHVMGAYAFTDDQRGVFKAPANVVIQGITGFTRDVPDGEQDLLNPNGVNVHRNLTGLGNVIWGARTIAADGLWKYVSVRRLFIFLEQSIIKGTRYAVFEPNDLRLWARLRDSINNFLTTQWRAGALFGATPKQAFFVKVDETTTTQDDRDNGRVNILVGIAPVKPAEFIVFQIGQAPQSVIIAESSGS